MTFETYETSEASGEPILLFDFVFGTRHWRYTTEDRARTFATNVYEPHPISRSAPVQSSDIRRQTMRVTASRFIGVAELFLRYPPSGEVLLTVTALHNNDPDAEGVVDWIGRVIGVKWEGSTVELACEPAFTAIQSMGLRRRWGVGCPHVLYGPACTLDRDDWKVTATIDSVDGVNITSSGFVVPAPGLSFAYGFIEWDTGLGYYARRTIESVSGTTLALDYGDAQLVAGRTIDVFPGCAHDPLNCASFGNSLNYGGQPYIPSKNPMSGGIDKPVY